MRVAIVSIDSDIGKELAKFHLARGDEVVSTSRHGLSDIYLNLEERNRWPFLPPIDRLYYLIATHERDVPRTSVMNINGIWSVEILGFFAKNARPLEIVVFSSHLGSISETGNTRAWIYRMSKSALNMGVKCMSLFYPETKWCLYHPGIVRTKMLGDRVESFNGEILEAADAARSCVSLIDKWDGTFKFLSYTGRTIPW